MEPLLIGGTCISLSPPLFFIKDLEESSETIKEEENQHEVFLKGYPKWWAQTNLNDVEEGLERERKNGWNGKKRKNASLRGNFPCSQTNIISKGASNDGVTSWNDGSKFKIRTSNCSSICGNN